MATLFGKEVRKLRIDHELTLRMMSDEIGLSPAYLSSLETGRRKLTSDVLDKIISFFHLTTEKADELRVLADKTNETVNIDLSKLKPSQSNMAVMLARKLDDLDDQSIEQIMKLLEDTK